MAVARSTEIEAVVRRISTSWGFEEDMDVIANLISSDENVRVLGSDVGELWTSHDEIVGVRRNQASEMGDFDWTVEVVEGFEDGPVGWAMVFGKLATPEGVHHLRQTAVLRLEAGVWRVIQWHNSISVENRTVFGNDLTTTLSDLVTSVLDGEAELDADPGSEGTVTLVFTDIVDSTMLNEGMGDAQWTKLVRDHERSIREIAAAEDGNVVKFLGDGSMLSFHSARAAVRFAMRLQEQAPRAGVTVRIGIHTGEVTHTAHDLRGLTVNKAARIAAAAGASETMLSSTTRDLVGSMDGVEFGSPLTVVLKGLSDAHVIVPVSPA